MLQDKVWPQAASWPQPSWERCSTRSPLLNMPGCRRVLLLTSENRKGSGAAGRANWEEAYFKGAQRAFLSSGTGKIKELALGCY